MRDPAGLDVVSRKGPARPGNGEACKSRYELWEHFRPVWHFAGVRPVATLVSALEYPLVALHMARTGQLEPMAGLRLPAAAPAPLALTERKAHELYWIFEGPAVSVVRYHGSPRLRPRAGMPAPCPRAGRSPGPGPESGKRVVAVTRTTDPGPEAAPTTTTLVCHPARPYPCSRDDDRFGSGRHAWREHDLLGRPAIRELTGSVCCGRAPGPCPGDTAAMRGCCDHDDYQSVFSGRFARRQSRRYQRRGLTPAAQGIVNFATSQGITGATVLEIGGGVGQLQVELLRRGASHVTNLEISENYEAEAARLLDKAGMTNRVTRRFLDIAQASDEVEPADVVVLHRVVCCYPDYARLLKAAAGHARKTLVYSHPAANGINRVQFGAENIYRWLTRNDFRTFIHPPEGMVHAAESAGLAVTYRHRAWDWDVVGLSR